MRQFRVWAGTTHDLAIALGMCGFLAGAWRFPMEYVSALDILVVRFPEVALR